MNYKIMGRFMAQILSIEGLFMVPALLISLFRREWMAVYGFLGALGFLLLAIGILWLLCRRASHAMNAKEGLVCVGVSWIFLSLFGCLPFWFSREIPLFIDAFFEIVSGFTTTGASVVPSVEDLSGGILYWRSFGNELYF